MKKIDGILIHDSTVMSDLYDLIFNNDLGTVDFERDFPYSYIDETDATIYLCGERGKPSFKLKIEEVKE